MKKLLTLAVFAVALTASAQSIGNTVAKTAATTATKEVIKGVSKEVTKPKPALVINEATKTIDLDATEREITQKETGYTAKYKDNSYPVYESAKGKLFIILTSQKTGKEYKKYLN